MRLISFPYAFCPFFPPSCINFVLILGKVLVVIRKKCTFA